MLKRKMKYEYPQSIQIETVNYCNAHCEFCAYKFMKRPKIAMSDEFFISLIQQIKSFAQHIQAIIPFLNGEMFLDKKIFERLQYINEQLPVASLEIFTNATLLDREKLDKLAKIKNIRFIHCSLNASNAQEYKQRVGLDFAVTHQNIVNLLKTNKKLQFTDEIVLLYVENGKENNDNFVSFVKELSLAHQVDVKHQVSYRYNYMGDIHSQRRIKNIKCHRLKTMCILADGLVSLCCMDMDGRYPLGNANVQPLLDIYNGEIARHYRKGKKFNHIPCRNCNMY